MRETIADGITGYLIEPESPELLADRVSRLCSDRDLCRLMGEAGRKRIEELFEEKHTLARLVREIAAAAVPKGPSTTVVPGTQTKNGRNSHAHKNENQEVSQW